MPETYDEKIDRILRDHQGYDGNGGIGALPVGDRSTAQKPIEKRDLREAMKAFANVGGNSVDSKNARDEAIIAAREAGDSASEASGYADLADRAATEASNLADAA